MAGTKELILTTALELFAREGYEAVSVSRIAAALGMTKGALYRHYRNKRDIFDHILARMEQQDAAQAADSGVPEGPREEMESAYANTTVAELVAFSRSMFRYWTRDPFAAPFRRLLTLEQYRSREMGALYQQYLAAGPMDYVADLLDSMGLPDARAEAAAFYAPMFLLWSVWDGAEDREAVTALADRLLEAAGAHLETQLQRRGSDGIS